MSRIKVNARGAHTSVIEGAREIMKAFSTLDVSLAPGVIQANVKARGKSVKLKKINNETFEMVVVVNGSKQTFKVYSHDQQKVHSVIEALRNSHWNVQEMMDISSAHIS